MVHVKCIWKHLISIFVNDHHFLDDLFEILIGHLNNTIHLGYAGGRFKMLNLLFNVELNNQLPIEIPSVVND